ncbi:T6SS phospholipase effector Tle1-like catalytic domain-containing protein [Luteimonas yindakuii]|nr:DUF2235 domain-containing protein [Luteimonas yindakuii]
MDTPGSGDQNSPAYAPPATVLALAAQGDARGAPVSATPLPSRIGRARTSPHCVTAVCKIPLWISVFFDGTGNNRDADESSHRDSNVARLFRSQGRDDSTAAKFAIYVPGIGTYFREIGDPGNTTRGMAFADYGQKRLDWALREVDLRVARYPAGKLKEINLALFGFSRGAALARAFARTLAEQRASGNVGAWTWSNTGVPLRLRFMGLFDTVASVGLPASADSVLSARIAAGTNLGRALRNRSTRTVMIRGVGPRPAPVSVRGLAYGAPGADPTPGNPDGHAAWAGNLRVPRLVEHCLHLVAAHEQRNSFPLDSVRNGNTYPGNCVEMVLPGVHSDLGGGYAPGFQGRIKSHDAALSNIALRIMHKASLDKGVPLEEIGRFSWRGLDQGFEASPTLLEHWNYYMANAGNGGRPLGQGILAHMRLYFAWRFQRIKGYASGNLIPDEANIRQQEQHDARKEAQMAQELAQLKRQVDLARARSSAANSILRDMQSPSVYPPVSRQELDTARAKADEAKRALEEAEHKHNQHQARWAGVPAPSLSNIYVYDQQLLADARILQSGPGFGSIGQPMRPHYAALLAAYEAEFVHNAGLRDQKIIDFFDRYVHDSLAGFAKDATLPSDPRAIYMGGDNEIPYASNSGQEQEPQYAARHEPALSVG